MMSLLIVSGCISLVGALLIDRRWAAPFRGRASPAGAPSLPRRRRLLDVYALAGVLVTATLYAPILARLPSAWEFLAARFSHQPHLQVQLIGPLLPAWLALCVSARWLLRGGLTLVGRTLLWVLLGAAAVAWDWCSDAASYVLLYR